MISQEEFVSALRAEYLDEAAYLLERCEEALLGLEASADRSAALAELFRSLHTIKGSGAAVGFECLVQLAHVMEDLLALVRNKPEAVSTEMVSLLLRGVDALKVRIKQHKENQAKAWDVTELKAEFATATQLLSSAAQVIPFGDSPAPPKEALGYGFFDDEPLPALKAAAPVSAPTPANTGAAPVAAKSVSIKVDAQRIDTVLDMIGELVIAKSQLLNKLGAHRTDASLQDLAALLDTIVRDLQDRALSIRMTPLKPLFLKLQRLARDLSLRCGKKVELVMVGEETELDRTMVEELADPLMHMMRNSIDHGIETVERRLASGKGEGGTIRLSARQVGSRVEIELRDDGGGLPKAKIVAKAVERGLISAGEISDRDAFQLIFRPGFSTAEKVSDVSGRGVGMDVVKTNVEKLKGTVDVRSEEGKYTSLVLSLPLTAAISDGILVNVANQSFLVPIDSIRTLAKPEGAVELRKGSLGGDVVKLRDQILPVIDLHDLVGRSAKGVAQMLVVVESEGRQAALLVDAIIGQMQVVMKPLGNDLCQSHGVAGAAIMGDGRVALVLDIQSLVNPLAEGRKAAA